VTGSEPTQGDIEAAYSGWKTWKGQLYCGLRKEGAALTVRGKDWLDLMDQIRRVEAVLEEARPTWWPSKAPTMPPTIGATMLLSFCGTGALSHS